MNMRIRVGLASLALMIAGLLGASVFAVGALAGAVPGPGTITDPVGDVVNDAGDALSLPQADIVSATVESRPEGVALAVRVKEPADPAKDNHWSTDSTYFWWQLDTTGDGKADVMVDYSAGGQPGSIAAQVTRVGPASAPAQCDAKPGFSSAGGYTVVIDPTCLGNPPSISYRVELTYDTKPGDDNAAMATDALPDEGMAGPVALTSTAGIPPSPAATSDPAAGPIAAPSVPPPTRPPTSAPSVAPARPASTSSGSPSGSAAPVVVAGAAPTPLAATGPSAAMPLAALGGALLLVGGFSLTVSAPRRSSAR